MTRMRQIPSRQSGAALIIGLILLAILTLLAVSGMNTSSMELVMAGNEQYRQRAFQASEAGVEEALTKLPTVSQSCTPVEILNKPVPNSSGDTYVVTAQYEGDGSAPAGFNVNDYVAIHYQVVSTGKSARNANAEQTQGALIVQNKGEGASFGCSPPIS